jgi:hypothetical protein
MTPTHNGSSERSSRMAEYVAGALMAAVLLLSGLLELAQFAN